MTLPATMSGWVLTGHGGPEVLQWREDLPVPQAGPGEVVIKVSTSSVNNTDINTRIGWYSKTVTGATEDATGAATDDAGWAGVPLQLPRIQGADVCGHIVAVGDGVPTTRIGERVIVRTMQSTGAGSAAFTTLTFGSEYDGGFAEYTKTYSNDAVPVQSELSDLELGVLGCAFSTAEGMLQRAHVTAGERVLITGASGGVGAAAVQLAAMRRAEVWGITQPAKADAVRDLGATQTPARDAPLPEDQFDVVLDLVGGVDWPRLLDALKRGGRYVTSGAIAGPIVELDLRTLYLKDLTLLGSTFQPDRVLTDLVSYVEAGKLRPRIAATYPLRDLHAAQEAFLAKTHVGKIAIDVAGGLGGLPKR